MVDEYVRDTMHPRDRGVLFCLMSEGGSKTGLISRVQSLTRSHSKQSATNFIMQNRNGGFLFLGKELWWDNSTEQKAAFIELYYNKHQVVNSSEHLAFLIYTNSR